MRSFCVVVLLCVAAAEAQDVPCACSMVRCAPGYESAVIPGTEDNCCGGEMECVPVEMPCACPMIRCQEGTVGRLVLGTEDNCCGGDFECVAEESLLGHVDEQPMFGGSLDSHGCISDGGYEWCEGMTECVRRWEQLQLDLDGDGDISESEWAVECDARSPVFGGDGHGEHHGTVGGVDHELGCVSGYQWCERMSACVRSWEEVETLDLDGDGIVAVEEFDTACAVGAILGGDGHDDHPDTVGGVNDEHGCVSTGGFQWCERMGACVRSWEEAETLDLDGDGMVAEEEFDTACAVGAVLGGDEHDNWQEQRPVLSSTSDENDCIVSGGYRWCESMAACIRIWEETQALDLNQDGKVSETEATEGCAAVSKPEGAETQVAEVAESSSQEAAVVDAVGTNTEATGSSANLITCALGALGVTIICLLLVAVRARRNSGKPRDSNPSTPYTDLEINRGELVQEQDIVALHE